MNRLASRVAFWQAEAMATVSEPPTPSPISGATNVTLNTLLEMVGEFDTQVRENFERDSGFVVSQALWFSYVAFFVDVEKSIPGLIYESRYDASPVYVRSALRGVRAQIVGAIEPKNMAPSIAKSSPSSFANRAEWLAQRMKERGWDRNDIARLSGPDVKTVQKIIDGRFVRPGGLEKLVVALNHKKIGNVTISLMDIPSD